jgi:hypothetical protein
MDVLSYIVYFTDRESKSCALHNSSFEADYSPLFTLKRSLYQLVSYKYHKGILAGSKGIAMASPMRGA